MTVDLKPPPTFSNSPWFWDGSASSLPEAEENVVQVGSVIITVKHYADNHRVISRNGSRTIILRM